MLKILAKVLIGLSKFLAIVVVILFVLVKLLEKHLDSMCIDELKYAVLSPNRLRVASVRLAGCGATTSESYQVFVSDVGSSREALQLAWIESFTTGKHDGIDICWTDDSTVVVSYEKAKQYHIAMKDVILGDDTINVYIHPGTTLSTFPCKP